MLYSKKLSGVLREGLIIAALFMFGATCSSSLHAQGKGKHLKRRLSEADKVFKKARNHRMDYEKALPIYLEVLDNQDIVVGDEDRIMYNVGFCYYNSRWDKDKCIPYFQRYLEQDDEFFEAHYFLGQIFHFYHRFDDAIEEYGKFKDYILRDTLAPVEINENIIAYVDKDIERCNFGKILVKNPVDVIIENIGGGVNSKFSEYAPVISTTESMPVLTRRDRHTTGGKISPDDDYFEDIYMSNIRKGSLFQFNKEAISAKAGYLSTVSEFEFGKPKNMRSINTENHEGAVQFSYDDQKLYLYHDHEIYTSYLEKGKWEPPVMLEHFDEIVNSKAYEPSVSISSDEHMIFISSERKGGYGGLDLYRSEKQRDGSWGEAVNLGPAVNTEYDEDAPYIDPNGRTLYFSSKGHSSMGGYDIFKSNYDGVKWWTPPQNMGYPINSAGDDIFFMMTPRYNRGYYSSNKFGGYGMMDIYRLTFADERAPMAEIKGLILRGDSLNPSRSRITVYDIKYGEELSVHYSDSLTGQYHLVFPHGRAYQVKVETEGFAPYVKRFDIPERIYYYHYYQEIHHVHIKDQTGSIIGQKVTLMTSAIDPHTQELDSLNITRRHHPPLAASDVANAPQAGKIRLDVLKNDTDEDDNIDESSVAVLIQPLSGARATTDNAGWIHVDYSAIPAFRGEDAFVYQVCDTTDLCDQDTVYISVITGSAPTAHPDSLMIFEDAPGKSINLLENDADKNGDIDPSSFTVLFGPRGGSKVLVDSVGTISYTPNPNYYGPDIIVYDVCDFTGLCDYDTLFIDVRPRPDPPVAVTDFDAASQQRTVNVDVSYNDSDPDGDLDYNSVKVVAGPTSGSMVTKTNKGIISLDYASVPGFLGIDTVWYEICDKTGACVRDTLFVQVLHGNPPIANPDSVTVLEDSEAIHLHVAGNDTDKDHNLDPTSVKVWRPSTSGAVAKANGTGGIVYVPAINFHGKDTIVYRVCDISKLCDIDTLFITVIEVAEEETYVLHAVAPKLDVMLINDAVDVKFYVSEDSIRNILMEDTTINISFPAEAKVAFYEPRDTVSTIQDIEAYTEPLVDLAALHPKIVKQLSTGETTEQASVVVNLSADHQQKLMQQFGADTTVLFLKTAVNRRADVVHLYDYLQHIIDSVAAVKTANDLRLAAERRKLDSLETLAEEMRKKAADNARRLEERKAEIMRTSQKDHSLKRLEANDELLEIQTRRFDSLAYLMDSLVMLEAQAEAAILERIQLNALAALKDSLGQIAVFDSLRMVMEQRKLDSLRGVAVFDSLRLINEQHKLDAIAHVQDSLIILKEREERARIEQVRMNALAAFWDSLQQVVRHDSLLLVVQLRELDSIRAIEDSLQNIVAREAAMREVAEQRRLDSLARINMQQRQDSILAAQEQQRRNDSLAIEQIRQRQADSIEAALGLQEMLEKRAREALLEELKEQALQQRMDSIAQAEAERRALDSLGRVQAKQHQRDSLAVLAARQRLLDSLAAAQESLPVMEVADTEPKIPTKQFELLQRGEGFLPELLILDIDMNMDSLRTLIENVPNPQTMPRIIIHFEFDKYDLSRGSMEKLAIMKEVILWRSDFRFEVIGHTDAKGPASYNKALGMNRAKSALNSLVSQGVPRNRLKAVSQGENYPIAPNANPDGTDNPVGRKLNRRVEFKAY